MSQLCQFGELVVMVTIFTFLTDLWLTTVMAEDWGWGGGRGRGGEGRGEGGEREERGWVISSSVLSHEEV